MTTHGEWWRILTAVFVHVGLMHLLVNMAILLNIGLFTERLFGNGGFTALYLLSGLGGSVASLAVAARGGIRRGIGRDPRVIRRAVGLPDAAQTSNSE